MPEIEVKDQGCSEIPATPPSASINRIRIVDLPGITIDESVRGEQAYHLLSAPALIRYAQQHAASLQLPDVYRDGDPELPQLRRELPRYVDRRLDKGDPDVNAAAEKIARRLGRNLGYILLTLRRGDPVNRRARPDWPDSAWEAWHHIRHVWVGGGIVSGDLGDRLIHHAQALLEETGYAHRLSVDKTPYPRNMALLGASRYIPTSTGSRDADVALGFDFGQTSAKRALLFYSRGRLIRLAWLPARGVSWRWRNDPDAQHGIRAEEVLGFVGRVIAESYEAVRRYEEAEAWDERRPFRDDIVLSIAAYVRDGKLLGNGIYAQMMKLADDAGPLIAERVTEICGWHPRVCVIHDGTAAAAIHAGRSDSAVIVVGTALGVGFPPATSVGLRDIATDLDTTDLPPQVDHSR